MGSTSSTEVASRLTKLIAVQFLGVRQHCDKDNYPLSTLQLPSLLPPVVNYGYHVAEWRQCLSRESSWPDTITACFLGAYVIAEFLSEWHAPFFCGEMIQRGTLHIYPRSESSFGDTAIFCLTDKKLINKHKANKHNHLKEHLLSVHLLLPSPYSSGLWHTPLPDCSSATANNQT